MTSAALSDDPEPYRRRPQSVATADRVFGTILDEVDATRGRRAAALRPLGAASGVPGAPGDPWDRSADSGEPPVVLAGRPGASATTSLWVHNVGAVAVSALVLRLTDLTAGERAVIPARQGTLRPRRVDVRSTESAEVRVTVAVPDDAVPGVYHGHVRGEGLPGTSAVSVRLVVEP